MLWSTRSNPATGMNAKSLAFDESNRATVLRQDAMRRSLNAASPALMSM